MSSLSNAERSAILDKEIRAYVKQGYRVISRTDSTVQLVKPKKFSLIIAIICLLLAVLPFILYVLIYMASSDQTIYLEVNERGKVTRR